jgi:tetratricopeptide (TPR) repeat protein
MKYKISALFVLAVGLLFGACIDELDIQKKGNYGGEENFYKTDDDAVQAITTVYSAWNSASSGLFYMLDMLGDDIWCGGGTRGDQVDAQNMNEYRYGTDNSTVKSSFSSLYGIIYNANLVIERVTPDTEVRKRCVAEAYFFRGWANLYLGSLWGTAPLVDRLLTSGEYAQGNSEEGALLAQASADFKAAIDLNALPSKLSKDDKTTVIRVTQEAAYAFYGKSLLFEGKKDEAGKALDKVINSKLYDFYEGEYGNIHKLEAEFSCESILENNQVDDANTAWSFMTYVHVWRGWRNDKLSFSKIKDEYSSIASGYGFFNPRKKLYEAFKAYNVAGGGNDYRLDQSIKTLEFLKNDMGLSVTGIMHGNEGYFNWKMRALKDELVIDMGGWNVCVNTNWRFMRYSEVLLLAAEAYLESDNGKALGYINQVRNRAKLNLLSSVTLDDIKQERRFELCFEGTRFIDLVRWGDAAAVLADQGKEVMCLNTDGTVSVEYVTPTAGFVKGKHERLPIPATEILLNENIKQNPGWSAADSEGIEEVK